MKILFSVGNFGFLRNFESSLRLLAERGHALHLVAERKDSVGGTKTLELLQRDYPDRVAHSYAPSRKDDLWLPLAVQLRLALDYWRYLDARYDHSPSLRARGASQAPAFARALVKPAFMRSRPMLALLRRMVRTFERAIPHGDRVERFLRSERPDLLLLTPLLYFGSQQVEYVRAAKAAGIRTALGVGSWDHLTTKGLIHEAPQHVLVWNEAQRAEADDLHRIAPERVTVTGAQAYDHWFVQQPSLSRDAFTAKVGVPHDRPLLLYLCSSPFITPHEVPFVRRWIAAIRASSDPVLSRAAILIRPHPQNAEQWSDFDPSEYEAVGIWPREGANPVDADARADYFDSMFYSSAVIGVNTSALIESGIVGRPVYTVLADDFAGQQEGTLHFQHLKNVNGGLLTTASTLDEHVGQLAGAVNGEPLRDEKSAAFIRAFVRPHGLDVPAAGRFVAAIEQQMSQPAPTPVRRRLWQRALAFALRPFALAAAAQARARRAARRAGLPAGGTARFMFAVASPEFLRYFDSTMQLLVERGHHVSVAVNWLRERKKARLHDLVSDDRIEVIGLIPKRSDVWTPLARAVRGTIDFVRYLDPRYADTPALRARMLRKSLPPTLSWLNRIRSMSTASVERTIRLLQAVERAIPVSTRVVRFLEAHESDVVIVSPLVDASSDQVDLVRAAQASGTPVVAGIASWDNLTNKGHMRVVPDMVTVWNDFQRKEAIELHGIPPANVVITGAQLFDRWFERQPSQSRADFCAMVGLPGDRPIVLYTGSSVFIARSELEVPFARKWMASLRASSDPMLREAVILVRPHPFNCDAWEHADFSEFGAVSVWPRQRYTPAAEASRDSFYDSLYYSAAVVGINTSAMIEAAILGRPVLSLMTGDFAGTQEGTLHFRYLLPENGGFLRVAGTLEQHADQLAEVLHHPEVVRDQTMRFVDRFLRPHGLDTPCTPLLAEAFERAAAAGLRAPARTPVGSLLLRPFAWIAAFAMTSIPDRSFREIVRDLPALLVKRARKLVHTIVYETRVAARKVLLILWRRSRRVAYETYDSGRRAAVLGGKRVSKVTRRGLVRPVRRAAHETYQSGWRVVIVGGVRVSRLARRGVVRPVRRAGYETYFTSRRIALTAGSRYVRRPLRSQVVRVAGVTHRLTHGVHHIARSLFHHLRRWELRGLHGATRRVRQARFAIALRVRGEAETHPSLALVHRRPLRILFSMRNLWYIRLYDSVLKALAAQGHRVHVLAEHSDKNEVDLEWLEREFPNVTFAFAPRHLEDDWVDLRIMIRLGLDHLRFLEPAYADATRLASRARERAPKGIVALADRPVFRTRAGRRLIAWALRKAEFCLPVDRDVAKYIREFEADVVLITPLLTLGSEQIDVLRTTRRFGIPTGLCVGSWDHLSSKALIRERPHRVFVWNETQKREAIELHHVPAREVVVTGAQCFDEWFDRSPALDRDAFCRRVGIDPSRPFVLYVCSALFEGSPSEAAFVVEWLRTLRGHPGLRDAGVLIRPHPKRGFQWDEVDISGFENVALWPPRGAAPFDAPTKADYYDSMFHSAAIAGLNTSALIEGGIVGRPVHTVLLPEFRESQEGTLHFRYLLLLGLLREARDLDTHVAQIAESVAAFDPATHHNRAFVESFVRPHGLGTPSTPIFVRQVEHLGSLRVRPYRDPLWVPFLQRALEPVAERTSGTFAEGIARARRRLEHERERAEIKGRLREERVARRIAERDARTQDKARMLEAREQEKVRTREVRLHERAEARRRHAEAKLQRVEQWEAKRAAQQAERDRKEALKREQIRLKEEAAQKGLEEKRRIEAEKRALERARKEAIAREREARHQEELRLAAETAARKQQTRLEKQQHREQRQREKEARLRAWQRTKQRAAVRSQVAGYFRRVIGAFTSNR